MSQLNHTVCIASYLLRDCRLAEDDDDDDGGIPAVDEAAAATAPEEGLPRGGGAADLKRGVSLVKFISLLNGRKHGV